MQKHAYGSWITTKAATVLATGIQMRTCTACGYKETKTLAKLTPTIALNTQNIKLKVKQSTTKVKVSGLAAGDKVVSWISSNKKIVTVTNFGKIIAANKTGTAVLTVSLASGKTAKVNVTVQKSVVAPTKITGLSAKITLQKGNKVTLNPILEPITSVEKITYSSSNKKMATVDSKGRITAKKKGTAKITVKSGSEKFVVTVTAK